jgi:hypothetical protein
MPTHRSRTAASQSSSRRRGAPKQQTRQARTGKAGTSKPAAKGNANGRASVPAKKTVAKKPPRGGAPVGVLRRREEPFTNDPRVLEAAYRAFERLPRPRYLH